MRSYDGSEEHPKKRKGGDRKWYRNDPVRLGLRPNYYKLFSVAVVVVTCSCGVVAGMSVATAPRLAGAAKRRTRGETRACMV